jgi:Mn-dependent DtxR family transcriptional regulator
VRPLVSKLETRGLIHIVSRNPLRLMLTRPGDALPHEPSAADMAAAKPGAYDRFLDAEGERMRLGRFIADTERKTGSGPSLRDMITFVGWAQPERVSRMAEVLAEKGLIQYGRGVPTRLTDLGRDFYGVKGAKMEQQTKAPSDKKTVVMVGKKPPAQRVKQLCEALASHLRTGGDNYIKYVDLAQMLGFSKTSSATVTAIVREAEKKGYLKPKPYRSHGLFFTDKGIAKFMPELVKADPDFAEVEPPQIEFTDRVAKDSPLREAALEFTTPLPAQVVSAVPSDGLDFSLSSRRLHVSGATQSRAELAAFIGKLGALVPFLGE